jgi:hypothetical protein
MKVLNIGVDSNNATPHKIVGEMDFLIKFHFTIKQFGFSLNYNQIRIY